MMVERNTPRDSARGERLDRLAGSRGAKSTARAVTVGDLADQTATDLGRLLNRVVKAKEAHLSDAVNLAANNTWYDGPSMTLEKGVYLLTAVAMQRNAVAIVGGVRTQIKVRLYNGTSSLSELATITDGVGGTCVSIPLCALVTITKTTNIKLQMTTGAGNAASYMLALGPDGGGISTRLVAVRIGD